MNEILSITNKAVDQLKKIISTATEQEVVGIKLGIDKSGCNGYSYKMEYAKKSDVLNFELIDKKGVKLFIDPKATMFLLGSEMDYTTDSLSSRFVFNNPNEKNTCGCGESFSL